MNYGKAIKAIRLVNDLQQKDFARLLKVDASYISKLESKQRTPTLEFLEKTSQTFNVPLYLICILSYEQNDLENNSENIDTREFFGRKLLEFFGNNLTQLFINYSEWRSNENCQ